jgi:cytochrome c oxidase cbb3-type subunit 3
MRLSLHAALLATALATLSMACNRNGEPAAGAAPAKPSAGSGSGSGSAVAVAPKQLPPATRGARLYREFKCGLCHGARGEGYAADFAPSLVSDSFAATATDAFLTAAITSGRPNTAMGAYGAVHQGPLSTDDVAALIAHIRNLRKDVAKIDLPPAPSTGDATRGAKVYADNCQRCHGDTKTRINAVQLGNPAFLASATDEYMRYAIVNGRARTPMVAWQSLLSAEQIEDVIAYIRGWQAGMPAWEPTPPVDPTVITSEPTPPARKAPEITGPIVINPKGGAPSFTLREDRFVPSAQVAAALKAGKKMVIIDARTPADWERTRIPGSIVVPHYATELLDKVPNDGTWVLAYCACPHHASGEIVDELRKRGYPHTAVIDEGIIKWEEMGLPVVHGADGKGAKPAPSADPHAGHAH